MSAPKKKSTSPFLKKAAGAKPPTRREMKRGLGRGLNALIAPPHAASAEVPVAPAPAPVEPPPSRPAFGETVVQVPPMDIERSPWQPRTVFKEETLNELADSIKANGVIEPLICRRRADGRLELICGERRLRVFNRINKSE